MGGHPYPCMHTYLHTYIHVAQYAEQQSALASAMAGWTEAASLQFSLVQELKTAEAKLQTIQSERDMLWQHLSTTASSSAAGTPRAHSGSLVADWEETSDVHHAPDHVSGHAASELLLNAAPALFRSSPVRGLSGGLESLAKQLRELNTQMHSEMHTLQTSVELAHAKQSGQQRDLEALTTALNREAQGLDEKLRTVLQEAHHSRTQGLGILGLAAHGAQDIRSTAALAAALAREIAGSLECDAEACQKQPHGLTTRPTPPERGLGQLGCQGEQQHQAGSTLHSEVVDVVDDARMRGVMLTERIGVLEDGVAGLLRSLESAVRAHATQQVCYLLCSHRDCFLLGSQYIARAIS